MGLGSHESGWSSHVSFKFLEGFLSLLGPLKYVLLPEQLKEREPPGVESRDESA
jgi:hypothetical protein